MPAFPVRIEPTAAAGRTPDGTTCPVDLMADPYQIPAPAPAPVPGDGVAPAIDLVEDVRWGPVDDVDESGRVVRTIEPEFGSAGGMREWLGTIPVRVSGGR